MMFISILNNKLFLVLLVCHLALSYRMDDGCTLEERSRYPWEVKIWEIPSDGIVGHGALLAADKVLSACGRFAYYSIDQIRNFSIIVQNFAESFSNCIDSRSPKSIKLHPECDPEDESEAHDFALWALETPFKVSGEPFLTPLLQYLEPSSLKDTIIARCRLYFYPNTTNKASLVEWTDMERCNFMELVDSEMCVVENCPLQPDVDLLCFKANGQVVESWEVSHSPESPIWLSGAVLFCSGFPVALVSRTFARKEETMYLTFSSFSDDLDFIIPKIPQTTTISSSSTTANVPSTTSSDYIYFDGRMVSRNPKITAPFVCTCLKNDTEDNVNRNGQSLAYERWSVRDTWTHFNRILVSISVLFTK